MYKIISQDMIFCGVTGLDEKFNGIKLSIKYNWHGLRGLVYFKNNYLSGLSFIAKKKVHEKYYNTSENKDLRVV